MTLAEVLRDLGPVVAHPELALEQLDANDGEHELQEQGDENDVSDGLDGHNDALHHVLEAFGSVDGTQRTEDTKNTKNLHHRDGARTV